MGTMKQFLASVAIVLIFAAPAFGQDGLKIEEQLEQMLPGEERTDVAPEDKIELPDYSHLTPDAERAARLDALFVKLKETENEERANLVAEEIWAIWLDSGSPTVNFLLRRGTAAEKTGDRDLARQMFAQVKHLEPDYAENWSRSGRLAFNEDDLNLALQDTTQALILEPRHFFALWTLGNIFERLGRTDEAYEAYKEANKLYPALKAVDEHMKKLQKDVEGDVL